MNYYNKYLKYKNKYLELKNVVGGFSSNTINCKKIDVSGGGDLSMIIGEITTKYKPNDLSCMNCLNLSMKNISGSGFGSGSEFSDNGQNLFNLFTNLEELDLSHNRLDANIDFIIFPPTLKKLNLSNNMFDTNLSNIVHLSNIEHLNISNNYLNFNFNELLKLVNLTYLNISNNNINVEIVNIHSGFENLEYLNISNNNIGGNIPEYFSKLSKIKYLNFANTLMSGKFNNDLFCLPNIVHLDFSIENFDFDIEKKNCGSLIINYSGSCWNLGIILMFLLSDKTSDKVIKYFNQYNTHEKKYNQIVQVDKKYNLDNIFAKSYTNSIESLKYTPEEKVDTNAIKKLIDNGIPKLDILDKIEKDKKRKLYLNKFVLNKNIETITNFITQIHSRIKFLNIQLDNNKMLMIEDISVEIEEKTQLTYTEIFPTIGRNDIGGGFGFEEINFSLLLGIIILNKQLKFEIFYNMNTKNEHNDYSNLAKVVAYPYNNIQHDYESKYNSCIGIIVNMRGHAMSFYECGGVKLFNNGYNKNKTYIFDYGIMFQNMNFLNRLNIKFNIYSASDGQKQYFIFGININESTFKYVIADNVINDINFLLTINDDHILGWETQNFKAVKDFIFVQIV